MGLSAEGAQSVKRYGNLWPQVVAFENLVAAALKAQRGKRYRGNVLEFNSNLEVELERIQEDLLYTIPVSLHSNVLIHKAAIF